MLIKHSAQNCHMSVDCDHCDETRPNTKGYAYVAQGATGRYCEVLWLCDDCGAKDDTREYPAIDVHVARERCNADLNGYADF